MNGERDVDELDGVRIARGAPARQALDFERDRPMLGDRPFAVERADVAPDHHPNDRVDIRVGDRAGADEMAVAQHRVAVAEAEHLLAADE